MRYEIRHEAGNTMRVHFFNGLTPVRFSSAEDRALRHSFRQVDGIEKVTSYPAVGGVRLKYSCSRDEVLRMLDGFRPGETAPAAAEPRNYITEAELNARKLHPDVKKKMKREVIVEAAADLVLPHSIQFAYHLYQFAKLRDM